MMPHITTSQLRTRDEFLQQVDDGRLHKPVAEASGLPNLAYTSADYYALEQQTVFYKTWVFAAFAHQLEHIGDMLPIEIAGQPLVLTKDESGKVRAFHNVCKHRGAKLVTECKNSRKFICPNHAWSFSLGGKLIARPHFYGGEKHDVNQQNSHTADLQEVACEIWFDWVFINLSGTAGNFHEHIQPILDRIEGYDFSTLHFASALEFDIEANWKLAVENFIEPYHVFSCHPWLNKFVGMSERHAPEYENHILFCGYEFQQTDPARGGLLPWFPDLPKEKEKRGDWFVLFPNFAFQIFADQVDVFVAQPSGATCCHETIALYFVGDGALADEYAEARDHVISNWQNLNHEDIGIIERMQAGRYSEGFDGGVLSPYWDPVQQHYARLISDSIREAGL